ncbi:MAG: PQQ-binding-like beta-propeller repeat protein [Lachnospiraceae bacterium]|nr:PQQ-binding-like beta-propeller repeat protein [Lachnospiraceae bacterium]
MRKGFSELRKIGSGKSRRKTDSEEQSRRESLISARTNRSDRRRLQMLILEGVAALVLLLLIIFLINKPHRTQKVETAGAAGAEAAAVMQEAAVLSEAETAESEAAAAPVEVVQNPATGDGEIQEAIAFSPKAVESTEPSRLIDYSEIMYNGEVLESKSDYTPWYNFHFGVGSSYTDKQSVVTFRGNNFRDNPTVGTAHVVNKKFSTLWTKSTGTLTYEGKTWSGNGWTGQPLIAKWPAEVRAKMNLYEEAKNKEDLVEVIYAGMDGYVYFIDLMTGEATRNPMYIGWTFKGAGALDPRGYPILYVGAGYNSDEGIARVFVVNLLDCSVMYTFGNQDSFSLRGSLSFFDSSALVDAESDTLIYPGENGILYLIHLNTQYELSSGTLSIDPDKIAKWHYWGQRTSDSSYWLGMEDSAAVYDHYMFVCDNGGNMMCLDLNALRLVWVQDILDDSNGSPVLSIEDGHLYVYISTSFHLGWRSDSTAEIPIWKLDAETGEVVWHTDYTCWSEAGVSGGVQSTIALGKNALQDYIYVTVSDTKDGGVCVCLNKKTGERVWEHEAAYSWSSPVCIYNADGSGMVIYCSSAGKMYLLDGMTGEQLDRYDFGEVTIEASPAVYDGRLVVGTRDCEIRCVDIT